MSQLISARALWTLVRAGDLRARVRANREGTAAIRLHLAGAAVGTGLLDVLAEGPAPTAELARRMGVADTALLGAFVRVVAAAGFVDGGTDGPWRLTARGRAVVGDDLVRAAYEAFPGFHTALYREIGPLLAGGPGRRDVAEQGALIARISAGFEPFVLDELTRVVAGRRPSRVLDVGCGSGLQLAAMLAAAPDAVGVGVDLDAGAVALAERTLAGQGLAARSQVVQADIRDGRTGPLEQPFDVAVLANVIYYVPMAERVALLRTVAGLLTPGGVLLVVTTVATPQLFSRHFDLLLRAQEGRMELSDADTLVTQLTDAGLRPAPPRALAPGAPVVTVLATRPG
ncbi:class I SAM-dependent methyltransferase [Blastococcus sp. CT_GayMR20]|uniref:class I SAM-dependent methyltransferase n=1 Tax=Blastococcus sp. CT_GayMR20 TaxID=2559609 RepID=UPI0010743AA3|nr:class I SAM-dependent methyltransferase [Blastococcus sp. CT_GayMR20]TFV91618.1 class I SAM-dependent methyltransferase [Blastococcus sp. CT_GayMR20]